MKAIDQHTDLFSFPPKNIRLVYKNKLGVDVSIPVDILRTTISIRNENLRINLEVEYNENKI